MKYFILSLILLFAYSASAFEKKSADEVLASGSTAEEKGHAIVKELDDRDFGFGDFSVDIEMILHNANGDTSTRRTRNRTFEMKDTAVGDKSIIVFDHPRDVKGTAFLTFSNILDPDDQWLYLPALERVKRISSKNKSGPFMGSEFAYEDLSSQELGKYKYKYLKNEPCGTLQCFVVEYYPQYPHSGYTRLVTWIDTKEFRQQKVDFYDRKNALYKTLTFSDYKQYLGRYWRAKKFDMVNHQNGKRTELFWKDYQFRSGLTESDFNKNKLKRVK